MPELSIVASNCPDRHRKHGNNIEALLISIRVARRIVFELYTKDSVLVRTSASGTGTVKPRALENSMHLLSAAYAFIYTHPSQPYHILLSNFFAESMPLPKQMMMAYGADSPTAVPTLKYPPHQQPSMETTERVH